SGFWGRLESVGRRAARGRLDHWPPRWDLGRMADPAVLVLGAYDPDELRLERRAHGDVRAHWHVRGCLDRRRSYQLGDSHHAGLQHRCLHSDRNCMHDADARSEVAIYRLHQDRTAAGRDPHGSSDFTVSGCLSVTESLRTVGSDVVGFGTVYGVRRSPKADWQRKIGVARVEIGDRKSTR